ncbi:MAG: polysaccharide deacetylase family protein [Planctomycetota bacterium]|nr:polysaccharide deacetylase family protein [Planctomycetota bacterium]
MQNVITIWRSGRNRNSATADWFAEFARFMGYEHAEVLDGFGDLSDSAVLVIPPGTTRISQKELSVITEAVRDGMGLLSFFDNSLSDEKGRQRTKDNLPSLGLADVLGLDLAKIPERTAWTFRVSGHQEAVAATDPDDPLWQGVDLTGADLPDGSPLPSFTAYNIRTARAFGVTRKTNVSTESAEVLARSRGHNEYWADKPEGHVYLAVNSFGKGRAAYISYEALPPAGPHGLIHTDLLFYWSFMANLVGRISPAPLPRIMQMPGGVTNLLLRIDDAGTDDGHTGRHGDAFHDTNRVLEASPYPMAVAVETDKISTPLGEERLRAWEAAGHVIVCHTRGRHTMNVDETEQEIDLRESKEKLERILGHPMVLWSIPGDYEYSTENTLRLAAEAGYELCGEYTSIINNYLTPEPCPLYPYVVRHKQTGVYIDVVTASGWLAINRSYDVRKMDEMAGLAEATGIPCMVEFVTHVPQGLPEYIDDWKAFMEDISVRLERGGVRITTSSEQLAWAKVRQSLRLASQANGRELTITVTNPSDTPASVVTVDCGAEVRSASSGGTDLEIARGRRFTLLEIPATETIKVHVSLG